MRKNHDIRKYTWDYKKKNKKKKTFQNVKENSFCNKMQFINKLKSFYMKYKKRLEKNEKITNGQWYSRWQF